MSTPDCSVIIRAFNEEKHIGRLLEGIRQQTLPNVEVILVDSGSKDATVSIAQRYGAKVVQIGPEEFTFGRSLNYGIQAASAPILVFASAHVYPVYPDWLQHMLAPFADPQIALVYGKQRGGGATKFSEHQIFSAWYPETTQTYQDTPFCNNANAAVRRDLALERPYNETLPGLEDLDWGRWAMQAGHKIHYSPEAEIIHVHEETPKGVYNRYRREAIAFKHLYIHERFGFIDFLRITYSNIRSDAQQAASQKKLWSELPGIIWFRACQFWGTYRGYRHHGPLTWQLRQRFYYPGGVAGGEEANGQRAVEPIQYRESD